MQQFSAIDYNRLLTAVNSAAKDDVFPKQLIASLRNKLYRQLRIESDELVKLAVIVEYAFEDSELAKLVIRKAMEQEN